MRERDVLTSLIADPSAQGAEFERQLKTTKVTGKNPVDVVATASEEKKSAQSEFRLPLLEALHELGGRDKRNRCGKSCSVSWHHFSVVGTTDLFKATQSVGGMLPNGFDFFS